MKTKKRKKKKKKTKEKKQKEEEKKLTVYLNSSVNFLHEENMLTFLGPPFFLSIWQLLQELHWTQAET